MVTLSFTFMAMIGSVFGQNLYFGGIQTSLVSALSLERLA